MESPQAFLGDEDALPLNRPPDSFSLLKNLQPRKCKSLAHNLLHMAGSTERNTILIERFSHLPCSSCDDGIFAGEAALRHTHLGCLLDVRVLVLRMLNSRLLEIYSLR